MKVYIGTEYLTHKRYVIRVQAEGRVVETLPPTRGNVARLRNQACARWAQTAESVEAGEIPEAWDRRAGGGPNPMNRTTKNTSATDAVPPLTPEQWWLCKVAVIRALDSLAPQETQLGAQLTALYVRSHAFGGRA